MPLPTAPCRGQPPVRSASLPRRVPAGSSAATGSSIGPVPAWLQARSAALPAVGPGAPEGHRLRWLGVVGSRLQFRGLSQARWEQSPWPFGELGDKVADDDMAKVEGFTAGLKPAPHWGFSWERHGCRCRPLLGDCLEAAAGEGGADESVFGGVHVEACFQLPGPGCVEPISWRPRSTPRGPGRRNCGCCFGFRTTHSLITR
jgi:hypothetical protein